MKPEILRVNLIQLGNLADCLSAMSYTDIKKTEYRDTLLQWNNAIQIKAETITSDAEHGALMNDMEILFAWMEDFIHSEQNQLPISLDKIVHHLCCKWITKFDEYVISISNGPFCVQQPNANMTHLLDRIRVDYGVDFTRRLITIRLPKHLKEDLFNTVCILHEVGHFFSKEELLPKIIWETIKKLHPSDPKLHNIMSVSFPWLKPGVTVKESVLKAHIDEYIADLFGAQYVGLHILNYLDYRKAHDPNTADDEHPSYSCRKQMVEAFLRGDKTNELLNMIIAEFTKLGKELKFRVIALSDDDFLHSEHLSVNDEAELLSIFNLAWDIYFNGKDKMEQAQARSISEAEFYNSLNSSLDKTIRSFYYI